MGPELLENLLLGDLYNKYQIALSDHVWVNLNKIPVEIYLLLFWRFKENKIGRIIVCYEDYQLLTEVSSRRFHSKATLERNDTAGNRRTLHSFSEMQALNFDIMVYFNSNFCMSRMKHLRDVQSSEIISVLV